MRMTGEQYWMNDLITAKKDIVDLLGETAAKDKRIAELEAESAALKAKKPKK